MKSASIRKDFTDHSSVGTISSYSMCSTSSKRSMATTYIDGGLIHGHYDRSPSIRDSFPKGKNRPKSFNFPEKKLNSGDVYLGLLPTESPTLPSEKPHSLVSSTTSTLTQSFNLPDVSHKHIDIRNKRLLSATLFEDKSESTFSSPYASTTRINSGWIRRHKSMNESFILTNLLRDQTYKEKILHKKYSYQQLLALSSPSYTSSLIKYRRDKC